MQGSYFEGVRVSLEWERWVGGGQRLGGQCLANLANGETGGEGGEPPAVYSARAACTRFISFVLFGSGEVWTILIYQSSYLPTTHLTYLLFIYCKAESIYNEEDEGSVEDDDLEAVEEEEEEEEEEEDSHTSSSEIINNVDTSKQVCVAGIE